MRSYTSFSFFKFLIWSCWTFSVFGVAHAQSKNSDLYFPPLDTEVWESVSPTSLEWDDAQLKQMLGWLETQNTRAFIVLKKGRIVLEKYWGEKLTGSGKMAQNSYWYWASAGKTLISAMVGIAEDQKYLKLKDPSQKYLGEGWTSLDSKAEKQIRIIHQLSMTTGLDNEVPNQDSYLSEDLKFLAKPGERWSYHNAPYSLLKDVLEKATGENLQTYFENTIGKRIGMKGFWQETGVNHIFYSDARSFARFGLMEMNHGNWNGETILPKSYFEKSIKASQKMNPSYGYLTWINNGESFMLPQSQQVFKRKIIPNAPADLFAAIGKNGQFMIVVPSKDLVIVRMGSSTEDDKIVISMLNEVWNKLSKLGMN